MAALTDSTNSIAMLHPSADEQGACQLCTRNLGGLARTHHCRRCQRLVCGGCSSATLPFATPSGVRRCRACHECVAAATRRVCASSTCGRVFSAEVARVSCGVCWRCVCERCVAFSLAPPIAACLECTAWRVLYRSGAPTLALERAAEARRRTDEPRRALAYERWLRRQVRAADGGNASTDGGNASTDGKEQKVDRDDDEYKDENEIVAVPEMRPLAAVLADSEQRLVADALGTIDAQREADDVRRVATLLQSGIDAVAETQRFVRGELTDDRKYHASGVDRLQQTIESAAGRVDAAAVEVQRADRLHAGVLPTLSDAPDIVSRVRRAPGSASRLARRLLVDRRLHIGALLAFGVVAGGARGIDRLQADLARLVDVVKTRCVSSTFVPAAAVRFHTTALQTIGRGAGVGRGGAKLISGSVCTAASGATVLARLLSTPVLAGFVPLLLRLVAQRARAHALRVLVTRARAHVIRILVTRAAARRCDAARNRPSPAAPANSAAA